MGCMTPPVGRALGGMLLARASRGGEKSERLPPKQRLLLILISSPSATPTNYPYC